MTVSDMISHKLNAIPLVIIRDYAVLQRLMPATNPHLHSYRLLNLSEVFASIDS
jgi:hypothetical protein